MANEMIWAYLMKLGTVMCGEPTSGDIETCKNTAPLLCDDATWKTVTEKLATTKCNLLLIDVHEGMQYETHPELAVPGSWTKQKLADEISRLKGMGFEVIPKLNFSTTHDAWLGMYSRMVSTPTYYKVCKDLIDEVAEVFGNPRFFHIGMDEEVTWLQGEGQMNICHVRNSKLFWHDLYYFANCVEAHGARPWIWADHVWHTPEKEKDFLENMTKDVLLSNWYYGDFKQDYLKSAYMAYELLEKHGFDQLPTASNAIYTPEYCRDNYNLTVSHCKKVIAPERLKGFMFTPWEETIPEKMERFDDSFALFNEAYDLYYKD